MADNEGEKVFWGKVGTFMPLTCRWTIKRLIVPYNNFFKIPSIIVELTFNPWTYVLGGGGGGSSVAIRLSLRHILVKFGDIRYDMTS